MKETPWKRRKLAVNVNDANVTSHWSDASVTIIEYVAFHETKEVTIRLKSPSDIAYVRDQLDKIEAGWRDELNRYCPPSDADEHD